MRVDLDEAITAVRKELSNVSPDKITPYGKNMDWKVEQCVKRLEALKAAPTTPEPPGDAAPVEPAANDPRCTCLIGVTVPGIMGPMTFTSHDANCPARAPAAAPVPVSSAPRWTAAEVEAAADSFNRVFEWAAHSEATDPLMREAMAPLRIKQAMLRAYAASLLAQADPPTGWQPMATAPKDGTIILVWTGTFDTARWMDEAWRAPDTCSVQPKFWQPLPLAPTAAPRQEPGR